MEFNSGAWLGVTPVRDARTRFYLPLILKWRRKMIEKEMTSREIKMFRLGKLEHAYKLGQKRLEKLNTGDAFKDLEEINKIFIEQKNITKKFLVLSEQLMPLSFKTHRVIKGLESQWG